MGRLRMAETVRISMNLAESLRRLHDNGRVHGALIPELVDLGSDGLELALAPEGVATGITPYTAPEVAQGQIPDARADIFAFGAIVFEMATGRRAFEGNWDVVPSSGNPALDKVIGPCVAKDPDARIPRIQTVMLDLKLLAVAARRVEVTGALRREKAEGATRSELLELELRVEERLASQAEAHERAIGDLKAAADHAMGTLREQISVLCSELAATQERLAAATAVPIETHLATLSASILAHVDGGLQTLGENTEALKGTVGEVTRRSQQFEQRAVAELIDLGRNVKAHSLAIEASRTNAAQNEDLMERVIEALESLQSDVLEPQGKEQVEEESALAV